MKMRKVVSILLVAAMTIGKLQSLMQKERYII